METAIVSIVCMALIVVGGMTMSQNFISSVDTSSVGIQQATIREEAILKTSITLLSATMLNGNTLEVSLRNAGQTKLASFAQWDLIVQYDDGSTHYATWLPYVSSNPVNNEWTVTGIYLNAADQTAEAYDPGILNPSEEIIIEAKLNPGVGRRTNNRVIISTPNGVSASIDFSRN